MTGPAVSLIMPVWKPDPIWLRQAVMSAVDDDADLEVVVVDDGNPTPIEELLAGIGVDDPRLRHVRIPHRGLHGARNAGIEAARGDYVRFVDADDVVASGSTSALLDRADPSVIVHAATAECDEELVPTGRVIASEVEGDAVEACLLRRFNTRHVSMLFPSWVVRAAGPWDPDLVLCSDWDFTLRCLEHAPVRRVDTLATHYRRHADSVTRGPDADRDARDAQQLLLAKFFQRHPERRGDLERRVWSEFHSEWAGRAIEVGKPGWFVAEATGAFRAGPGPASAIWKRGAKSFGARFAPDPIVDRVRPLARRWASLPKRLTDKASARRRARWGNLRHLEPFSDNYGYERGTPVDRTHLHAFFAAHADAITGRVLEVRDPGFTERYGCDVSSVDLVDIDPVNTRATIIADLALPGALGAGRFDCIIVPQTLQYVSNPATALSNAWTALRPGGVLLVTVPCIARIDRDLQEVDHWRFLPAGLESLLMSSCPGASVHVEAYGNLVTTVASLLGLASEELDDDELSVADPRFPIVACARVERREDP